MSFCPSIASCAPNGANHQPWHFVAISDPVRKCSIRKAAETEERRFYGDTDTNAKAGADWLDALAPIGTNASKPFPEIAPWLIAVFAQRKGGIAEDGETQNYYVNESVGIAYGGRGNVDAHPFAHDVPARVMRTADP